MKEKRIDIFFAVMTLSHYCLIYILLLKFIFVINSCIALGRPCTFYQLQLLHHGGIIVLILNAQFSRFVQTLMAHFEVYSPTKCDNNKNYFFPFCLGSEITPFPICSRLHAMNTVSNEQRDPNTRENIFIFFLFRCSDMNVPYLVLYDSSNDSIRDRPCLL